MKRIRDASVKALRRVQSEGPVFQVGRYLENELVATTGLVDCPVVDPAGFISRLARLIEDVARMKVDVPLEVLESARGPKGRKHSRDLARALARAGYPADGPVHQAIMREYVDLHATLRLAFEVVWDLETFNSLGHIPGVDEGRSCYRVHGGYHKAPAILASGIGGVFDAFVVLVRRAEDGPSGDVVGRCWGLVNHEGVYLSNAYWGAKIQHGAGIRPFQKALSLALFGDKASEDWVEKGWARMTGSSLERQLRGLGVYCNGDGVGFPFDVRHHDDDAQPFDDWELPSGFLGKLYPPVRKSTPAAPGKAPSPRHPFGGAAVGTARAGAIRVLEAEYFRYTRNVTPQAATRAPLAGAAFDAFVAENVHYILTRVRDLTWVRYTTVADAADVLGETGQRSNAADRLVRLRHEDAIRAFDLEQAELSPMDLAMRLDQEFWWALQDIPDWGPALHNGVARRWAAQRALEEFNDFMASVDVNTVAFGVRTFKCCCREEPL